MKTFITSTILSTVLVAISCAGPQSQTRTERSVPQCLSMCGNQFAMCTEEYPGDASACLGDRRQCEQSCEAQKAVERMEEREEDVIVPTDAEEVPVDTVRTEADEAEEAEDDGQSGPD